MDPSPDQDLPQDWQEQIIRAYTVLASRHITPAMRSGWARQRRRGRGRGGGQWMPTAVVRIPVPPPKEEEPPGGGALVPEEPTGIIVVMEKVEDEEGEEEVGIPVVGPGPAPTI